MTDPQLISKTLSGDTSAFTGLVDRYIPLVRSICGSQIFDPLINGNPGQCVAFVYDGALTAGGGHKNIGYRCFSVPDNFDIIRAHTEVFQPFQAKAAFVVITEFAGISNLSAQAGYAAGCRTALTAAFCQPKLQGHFPVLFRKLIDNGDIIQTAPSDHQYINVFHNYFT